MPFLRMAGRWGRSFRLTTTFTLRAKAMALSNVLNWRPSSMTNIQRRWDICMVRIAASTGLSSGPAP